MESSRLTKKLKKKVYEFDSITGELKYEVMIEEGTALMSDQTDIAPSGQKYPKFDITTSSWIEAKPSDELLNETKDNKIKELKVNCASSIYKGFTSTVTNSSGIAMQFGFKEHDQMNFNSQLNKINLWKQQLKDGSIGQVEYDAKFPLSWKSTNLGVVQLTELQFIQILDDAEKHQLTQQKKYWDLESQVTSATTEIDISAVAW